MTDDASTNRAMSKSLNEIMMDAVAAGDTARLRECLANGADANYQRALASGERSDILQPRSPITLLMFRISDSMLDDHDLARFVEVAKVLIESGADPEPGMRIARERYGEYDRTATGPFMDVWHVIANAIDK